MATKLKVHGIPPGVSKERLVSFFQNKRKQGGGPVESVELNAQLNEALVTFKSPDAVNIILKRGPTVNLDGTELKLFCVTDSKTTGSSLVSSEGNTSDKDNPRKSSTNKEALNLCHKQEKDGKEAHEFEPEDDEDTESDFIVRAKVADVTKSKQSYSNYLDFPETNTGKYLNQEMILDGLNGYLYIPFIAKQDALRFCRQKHEKESNILSAKIAGFDETNIYKNLMSVHCKKAIDKASFIEFMSKFISQEKVLDVLQQDKTTSVIAVLDINSYEELSTICWQCANENLDGCQVVTAPVQITQSILVSGLNNSITDNQLQWYLCSPQIGGGSIDHVKRLNHSQAVVTFKDAEGLERVVDIKNHELEKCCLEVQVFHPCLSKIYHEENNQLDICPLKFSDEPLFSGPKQNNAKMLFALTSFVRNFLTQYPTTMAELIKEGTCKWNFEKDVLVLALDRPNKLKFKEVLDRVQKCAQKVKEYFDSCAKVQITCAEMQSFFLFLKNKQKENLEVFYSSEEQFLFAISDKLKKPGIEQHMKHLYNAYCKTRDSKRDSKTGSASPHLAPKQVVPTVSPGPKANVDLKQALQKVVPSVSPGSKANVDSETSVTLAEKEVKTFSKAELMLFQKIGLLEKVRAMHKSIKIEVDLENCLLILKGPNQSDFNGVQIAFLQEKVETLKSTPLSISAPLEGLFRNEKTLSVANELLTQKQMQGILYFNENKLYMTYTNSTDPQKVVNLLEERWMTKTKSLDGSESVVLASEKGKTFLSALNDKYHCLFEVVENSQLRLTTVHEDHPKLFEELKKFISENKVCSIDIQFSFMKQKFVQLFLLKNLEEVKAKMEKVGLKLETDTEKFTVKGLEIPVKDAKEKLESLRDHIQCQEHELNYFGIEEFLQSEDGQRLMKEVGQENYCLIGLKNENLTPTTLSQSQSSNKGSPLASSRKPVIIAEGKVGNCTITMCQGNLLGLKAEAVVHPLDTSLECGSRLTKDLIASGAPQDIQSCFASKEEGEVGITSGGQLSFGSVLHVICPINNGNNADELTSTIGKILTEAKKRGFKSLAFPALGAGKKFKFHDIALVNSLMNALKQHIGDATSLTQVFICDKNGDIIKQLMNRFGAVFGDTLQTVNALSVDKSASKSQASVKKDFGAIQVNVVQGEITKQETDIIVTTVDRGLNLGKGVLSKSVLKYGGQEIQDELSARYSDHLKAGTFAESGGGKLKCSTIFHAFLPKWSGQDGGILTSLMKKILIRAHELGKTSISISALGTGRLGYPKDYVAASITNSISDFSMKYPSSTLQSVDLVVFHADTDVLQEFQGAVSQGGPVSHKEESQARGGFFNSRRSFFGQGTQAMKFGSLQLQIKKGDILNEKCDAIVNGIEHNMQLKDSGAVGKAILQKCGEDLQAECDLKKNEMAQFGVAMTNSHGLASKYIIHVSLKFGHNWDKGVEEVLKEAHKNGLKSLALPAVGTGARGADLGRLKTQILGAIQKFGETYKSSLTDVRLVIYDQKVFDVFISYQASQRKVPKVSDKACVKVYYTDVHKSAQTIKMLKEKCGKDLIEHKSTNERYKKFTDEQVQELETEGLAHLVKVTVQKKKGVVTMQTFMPKNLPQVQHKMFELVEKEIDQLTRAVPLAVQWQFKSKDSWRDFEPKLNIDLESAYTKYSSNGNNPNYQFHQFYDSVGRKYAVNFKNNTEVQIDEEGNERAHLVKVYCSVRRQDKFKEGEPLPPKWDEMKEKENLKLVTLSPSSNEYKKVEKKFKDGGASFPIKKIVRIQNKYLYQQYKVKKREMDLRNHHLKNELQLFHGTTSDSVAAINENGFNRNYCGKNATVHGKGVYFSTSSQYSAGYAQQDANGDRQMYVARVLVGESISSTSSMQYLPNKPNTNIPYDSGKATNMFIIFHDAQTCPEYLIYF